MELASHMPSGEARNWLSTVESLRRDKTEAVSKQDELLA